MAQKTDLNISPYYDDFDKSKNFYKVLFKPGFPVQARELTTLQSILQNQVESFGSNIFKEGSMVLPGAITFDNDYSAVKLNATNLGVDVSAYINNAIGKTITGQSSGVSATIKNVAFTTDSDEVDNLTIYVKYGNAGTDSETTTFTPGEELTASENITFGNTVINSGTVFASVLEQDAIFTGAAASIDNGVYFVRGNFVNVSKQTLILDFYTNVPSYRVGLKVSEIIVNAKDDDSLYDNAKGFTNFAAPGADRFKIDLTLVKKSLTDFDDTDFIEVLRVDDGKIKKVVNKTVYNIIRDYIAERTFDESGHYTVDEFRVNVLESLNDRVNNDGLFLENELTEDLNTPSDDLMCVQVSPGKAYVSGYDVQLDAAVTSDVEKPRDTENISSINVPFEMGHLLRVNNVAAAAEEHAEIELKSHLKGDGGSTIGKARVYTFNLTDAAYSGAATQWDLYLYDIQTYTNLTFNRNVSASELPATSFIKGKSSGASGFAVAAGANSAVLNIYQTSGTFVADEELLVNGVDASLTLKSFIVYGIRDIKSVSQTGLISGTDFTADAVLSSRKIAGVTEATLSSSTFTSPGNLFTGIKVGDIIKYQAGNADPQYNRVTLVNGNLTSIDVTALGGSDVSGVYDKDKVTGTYNIELAVPELRNNENASLFASLPDSNVASINLSNSQLSITKQIENLTVSGNKVQLNLTNVGITSASYESFDQERYSVHYSNGGIGAITSDNFDLSGNVVTISGLNNGSGVVVNATLIKNGIQSKIKQYTRSVLDTVEKSILVESNVTTDGLSYNEYYGLRVQDDKISLNVPDVSKILAIYESTNLLDPTLDKLKFSSISQVHTNSIIGEDIIGSDSGALARIVTNNISTSPLTGNDDTLGIVYLNDQTFTPGENVVFKESNIISTLESITLGKYKNITNNFTLDKGQRNEYYDYSRLVRVGTQVPEKRLLIVYDHYTVANTDNGDVFTVLSYDAERFTKDIPLIGSKNVRASDTLDFRPRVPTFDPTTTKSPFDFASRNFATGDPKFTLKPGEGSLVGYDFYLPRIDRVYLDKFGSVVVRKGVSAADPKPPSNEDGDLMQLAQINLPAYLYDTDEVVISSIDNRRYTMRDIGNLEDRIENLERLTSLTLLELNTKTLKVEDSNGNDRFKSGIFVDNFNNSDLSNKNLTTSNIGNGELRPFSFRNTLQQRAVPAVEVPESQLDLSQNYELLDPNVQKTGNAVTLKYDSVDWLSQSLATRVENVNPFHVVEYNGLVTLSPNTDTWIRTISLPPRVVNVTINRTVNRSEERIGARDRVVELTPDEFDEFTSTSEVVGRTTNTNTTSNTVSDVRTVLVSSGAEKYVRSRNVAFFGTLFRPLARHYQFLDNHSNVTFIPKLVEIASDTTLANSGSSNNSFQAGETVRVFTAGNRIGTFRLATSNHKTGAFNSPATTYSINPYANSENIASGYSQSSKTINIDLNSLSAEDQGSFSGYFEKGSKIVGQTSGAIAYVKDLRLISDTNGTLFGSFFIKNPHVDPAPNPRILTGRKTYRLSSSATNEKPLPGSTLISAGDSTYTANGTLRQLQQVTTLTTTVTSTITTITTRRNVRARRVDPLAQSFVVGRDIDAPTGFGDTDDDNGVFVTKVDLFFASKPSGGQPLTVEMRTVELGIPTLDIVGEPKTLTPDQIATSADGKTATTVVFDYPIYLPPGQEYAIVLLAPNSDQYEVWTAKMGETTIETTDLPPTESVRYTKQFALGSLFKSQNGSVWTPAQESDLKFKLYKAKFTADTGIVHFANPPLDSSNGYVPTLDQNTLTALPKNVTLGITPITPASDSTLVGILTAGRRIAGAGNSFGTIVSTGSSATGASVLNGGANYSLQTNASTINISGRGSGLTVDIGSVGIGSSITSVSVNNKGSGYKTGDTVSIVNGANTSGRNAIISISASGHVDKLFLSNVQGSIPLGDLVYFDDTNAKVSLGNTDVTSSTEDSGINSGNYFQVQHFNHGMYANNNKVLLSDISSDTAPAVLTSNLSATASSSTTISVDDSTVFTTFEGQPVNTNNLGYVKIGDEVIAYESAAGNLLTINSRAVEGIAEDHAINDTVMKYEFNGLSLRRINNVVHDISDIGIESDSYYIEVDRSTNGIDRSTNGSLPQASFSTLLIGGGNNIKASENIMFNRINPRFDIIAPGRQTSVTSNIRTTSGTSIDGNEVSFTLPNTIEEVTPNRENDLTSVRMVASRVNELNQSQFDNVSGRRSFNSTLTFNTTDENLSPIVFTDTSTVEFILDDINNPISDYTKDSRVNSLSNDPHEVIYVSNTVNLAQPASSLKVLLTAYKPKVADIRVLYSLIREDSAEIEQSFELFPGFDNLELTSSGELKVVDPKLNDGRSDSRVPPSEKGQFLEYEFTANDLEDFSGYAIKIVMSSTDQANSPIIRDLRTLAVKWQD